MVTLMATKMAPSLILRPQGQGNETPTCVVWGQSLGKQDSRRCGELIHSKKKLVEIWLLQLQKYLC